MKKYIMFVLFSCIFQGDVYSSDYYAKMNKAIGQQLISARNVMNNKIKLELVAILPSLLSYVRTGTIPKSVAIDKIEAIKKALEKYKAEQYPTTWSKWFESTPVMVKNYINPALIKIDGALQALNASSMDYNFLIGGATILGIGALFVAALRYINSYSLDIDDARRGSASSESVNSTATPDPELIGDNPVGDHKAAEVKNRGELEAREEDEVNEYWRLHDAQVADFAPARAVVANPQIGRGPLAAAIGAPFIDSSYRSGYAPSQASLAQVASGNKFILTSEMRRNIRQMDVRLKSEQDEQRQQYYRLQ